MSGVGTPPPPPCGAPLGDSRGDVTPLGVSHPSPHHVGRLTTMRKPRRTDRQWIRLRDEVLTRARASSQACAICGQPINYTAKPNDYDAPAVDHIQPWSKYPELRLDPMNLQVAHRECNLKKSDKRKTFPSIGNQSRQWNNPRAHKTS